MENDALLRRGALKVLLDISNKCNLRCTMCHFSFDRVFYRPAEFLTPEQFRLVAAQVFPYAHTVVLSAGSEPTVSPHFEEILRLAAPWPLQELKFLTNGVLLDEAKCRAILESNVTQIDVSVDGATRDTYEKIRRGARFDKLVTNLKRLHAMKTARGQQTPLVQFNITLMRSNVDELEMFVDLAEACGVERIGARHVMPYEGLDVSGESLFAVQAHADAAFRRFIARIEHSSVRLITFPDFFGQPAAACSPQKERRLLERQLRNGSVPLDLCASEGATPREGAPFGYVDIPAPGLVTAPNTLQLAGWALDSAGPARVCVIARGGWLQHWQVLAIAKRVNGSRPDVAALYGRFPENSSAGWVCEIDARELPRNGSEPIELQIVAINSNGVATIIGTRQVRVASAAAALAPAAPAEPFLFCRKPFNSIYIDSGGDVYPYADCRPERPSGNLLRGQSFDEIWHGEEQRALRQAIIEQRPPAMCTTCPNFINRKTGDAAFFKERRVEERYVALPRPRGKRSAVAAAGAHGQG